MNNEGMGSWGFLAFLIFAIFAFGGNGFGGGFGGRNMGYGNAGTIADIGITSQLDNIQSQNFYNSLNSGISGNRAGFHKRPCLLLKKEIPNGMV